MGASGRGCAVWRALEGPHLRRLALNRSAASRSGTLCVYVPVRVNLDQSMHFRTISHCLVSRIHPILDAGVNGTPGWAMGARCFFGSQTFAQSATEATDAAAAPACVMTSRFGST